MSVPASRITLTEASYDWHSLRSGEEDECWAMPWILLRGKKEHVVDL